MVDPHFIDQGQGVAEALDPPVVSVFCHCLVIVEGVAPELAFGTEIVRRHAGHTPGISCLIEVEQVLMGPAVGAVVGDEHGDIPQDRDAVVMGIDAHVLPLTVYDVLKEAVMIDRTGQFLPVAGTGRIFVAGNVFRPFGPGLSFEEVVARVATKGGITEEGSKIIYEQFPSTADAMFHKTLDKRKQTAQNAAKAFSAGE